MANSFRAGFKWRLLLAASSAACASQGIAQEVSGADGDQATAPSATDQSSSEGLQEIVVTARKIAENLQDVPVAITAFTGEQLQQQSAVQVRDIARLTPGLVIRPGTNGNSTLVFQLRGQFQNDTVATVDPSVGIYVDGLYWARAYGINSDLLDVASVQTLKGPQGTLFGRNTTGGAILFQTNDPRHDEFSGRISATYGNFNNREVSTVLNVPLIEDKLTVRGAFSLVKRDGYILDTVSGEKHDSRDNLTGRVKLLYNATDNLSLLLSAEVFDFESFGSPFKPIVLNPGASASLAAGITIFGPGPAATRLQQGQDFLNNYIASTRNRDTVSLTFPQRTEARTNTYTGKLALETFFGTVQFIGGYRRVKHEADLPLSGAPYIGFQSFQSQDLEQYSGELQITGNAFDDRLSLAAGMFYFEENGTDISRTQALPTINPNNPAMTDGTIKTLSQGLYGQATWKITDRLSATGGLRYSIEDKGVTLRNQGFNAAAGRFLCSIPTAVAPDCITSREDDFGGVSYTAGLDYQFEDALVYIKTSKGFRSGGQNLRASGSAVAFQPFGPERVVAHELGLKSEFFDQRVRFNAAAYYSRVSGLQRSALVLSPTGQAITIVGNAGKARIWGIEAELNAVVAKGLELSGTYALTKPKYLSYFDGVLDRRSEPFDATPKHTFSLTGAYSRDFSFGSMLLRLDYAWRGRTPITPYTPVLDTSTLPAAAKQALADASSAESFGLLNARASISLMDDALELAVFGRNITNNRQIENALYLPGALGTLLGRRREPATYGATATFRFGNR